MKYVESFGMLFRMSDKRYREMLQKVADGGTVEYSDYGKCVGVVDLNASDLDQEAAARELEQIAAKEKRQ